MQMLVDWGMPGMSRLGSIGGVPTDRFSVNKIKLLCVLASQTGLDRVRSEYPDLEVRNLLSTMCFTIVMFRRSGYLAWILS